MKLAIIGSRDYRNREAVRSYIEMLSVDTIIVTGGWASNAGGRKVVEATVGVDREAYIHAERSGLVTVLVAGSKTKHGNLAGKLRNPVVVDLADCVVAFWDLKSRGTANTLAHAMRLSKPTRVIGTDGAEVHEVAWQAAVNAVTR